MTLEELERHWRRMEDDGGIITRSFHGIAGALLGALIGFGVEWFYFQTDSVNWAFVCVSAGTCFFLAFLGGPKALAWLTDIWWWT